MAIRVVLLKGEYEAAVEDELEGLGSETICPGSEILYAYQENDSKLQFASYLACKIASK